MAIVRGFKALRPDVKLVKRVQALPYDVMNRQEAKQMAEGNEYSYLHIDRAEIDLDDSIDIHDERVYKRAAQNLKEFEEKGILVQDDTKCLYIYRQIMNNRAQIGIVGCVSVDDSMGGVIKKHEYTKPDKEEDRTVNIKYCKANTGTILLTYRNKKEIDDIVNGIIKNDEPLYDFVSEDGVAHTIWRIAEEAIVAALENEFKDSNLYVADGHHRCAAAENVAKEIRAENPDYDKNAEFNYFTAMIAPDNQLYVMDYNRVISDLNNMTVDELIERIGEYFDVEEADEPVHPQCKKEFGMCVDGKWYRLKANDRVKPEDVVADLDVSVLHDYIIEPILEIDKPRTDKRIDYVGGIRGLEGLEARCKDDMRLAFSLFPTPIEDLLSVADEDRIMPAKSTWFEPKVRCGLFIHKLDI